ncbi:MAG: signal peptidase II [Lachnospiraceae bacterium]|nr:signal peptidase II [Lachnospiraceae bacterium]
MKKLIYLVYAAILIFIDQVSKYWIVANLKGKENIVLIKKVFELEYVENDGAAFSSFSGKQVFLLILTVVILSFVIFEFIRIPEGKKYIPLRITFMLLVAGAIGNMIDRVKQGYVVDFFYFVPINFPRFNVADIFITVAAIMIGWVFIFIYKEEDTAFLFNFKKN